MKENIIRKRSGGETPRPGRSDNTGEECDTGTSTSNRDDGVNPDCVTKEIPCVKLRSRVRIGTWNVRSLYERKLEVVCDEIERINIQIL